MRRSRAREPRDGESLIDAVRRQLEARSEIVFAILPGSFAARGAYRDVDVAVWVDASRRPDTGWHRYGLDLAAQ